MCSGIFDPFQAWSNALLYLYIVVICTGVTNYNSFHSEFMQTIDIHAATSFSSSVCVVVQPCRRKLP